MSSRYSGGDADVESKRMSRRLAEERRKADDVTQRAAAMIKVIINAQNFTCSYSYFLFKPG